MNYLIIDIEYNINQYWFEKVDYKTGNQAIWLSLNHISNNKKSQKYPTITP